MTNEFVDIEEARDELMGAMCDFSQENWAAGWMDDLDIDCQKLIDGDDDVLFLTSKERLDWYKSELARLHNIVHGWWVWLGEGRKFMSDSEVKAFRAVKAEWYAGNNYPDIECFVGEDNFTVIENEPAWPTLEIVDAWLVKHTVTENQWVVRDADGRFLVLDPDEFAEYIKPKESK